ncbi:beta-glucuronidase [Halanaerobium saccharolyticum]|uniref:Beta-glucuronidase n=1 Tax=Halanaerobium saccharolyticum TaxID=43595 RepID=A0A4R6LVG7_9FIRM|nr:glycoside hydrolase family 2 TIM barrel-domain containing protein [Halanaerobium saccharolyticum]TDO91330.1 beta-glucuronidase [Halanaerobium saccharolyticum]
MAKDQKEEYSHIHDDNFMDKYQGKELTNDLNCEARDPFITLDGDWNYSIDIYDSFLREEWYTGEAGHEGGPKDFSFSEWETMELPASWNNEAEELSYYEGSVIFHREFQQVKTNNDKVFLRIGAINYESLIFINKHYVGKHSGGFTPFTADITEYLEKNNKILVLVNNDRKKDRIPSLITDWFNYGGIYREVEIYKVPEKQISDYFSYLVPDGEYNKIKVSVETNGSEGEKVEVKIGNLIDDELKLNSEGKAEKVFEVKKLKLWSTDNPYLYNITLSYNGDVINDQIGFRQVEVEGNDILVNGEKIFLKGVSAHEDSVKNGKALTEAERLETLKLASDMNCNFMRLAHYPHHENMSKLADKLGILLWEEIPVYWSISFDKEEVLANGKKQLRELINRDKNRASVIIWSVGNENPDTEARYNFMSSLIDEAKKIDPSRLTSAACLLNLDKMEITDRLQDKVDVIGINEYFEWYYGTFDDLEHLVSTEIDKPVIVSEFGGSAAPDKHGEKNELWTEENQKRIYQKQLELLTGCEWVAGLTPWILYDFKTPKRINKYQQMYNLKGLVSKDKKYKKLAYYVVQEFYNKL